MSTTQASDRARDYPALLDQFGPETRLLPSHLREDRMREVVDVLWGMLGSRGVSWIGIYTKQPRDDQMILGPCRPKPACSPLGLQGICGRSWLQRKPIIVRDVATLGKNYIACDPRDKSEVVIPLFEADGHPWGVLDADSYETGSFEVADVIGLTTIVEHAGLSTPTDPPREILRL